MNYAQEQKVLQFLRKLRLLDAADMLHFLYLVARHWRKNRLFRREHRDYPVPSAAVAFDAYGYVDWKLYRDSGIQHARVLAEIITQYFGDRPLSIFEWGCGPGRVIRHLQESLKQPCVLTGSDINRKSVDWCRANLPSIHFAENGAEPPLPFEAGSFDCIIARSVFTHLSEPMHYAWRDELLRVLKPGGLILLTAHGEFFKNLHLSDAEKQEFDAGRLVVRGGILEGRKWYTAFHPPAFMKNNLLKDLKILIHVPGPVAPMFEQDLWGVTCDREAPVLRGVKIQ
jgi:SAM-dependent methyltransferase